jgi:hypothetical protein
MTAQAFETGMQLRLRTAIHQPNFFPRLKVLQKIASADVWCVLDSVQYCAREWQNRTRIVAMHGDNQASWLSVPVQRPHGRNTLISEISIVNPSLTARLVERTLFYAFKGAPYWDTVNDLLSNLKPLLAAHTLTRLCVDTTCSLLRIAGRQPTLVFASSLPVKGKASTLMAAICRYLNANTYLADSGARNYLQPTPFREIEVLWQNWCEPAERSLGISSWRDISSVNFLARFGPDQFTRHILSGEFIPDPSWTRLCPT